MEFFDLINVTNGIEINHVSMIDCDRNATFSDVAILKYWKNIFWNWITKPNENKLQISCFHLLLVMIHIKIKIGDNLTKILKMTCGKMKNRTKFFIKNYWRDKT